MAGRYRRAPAPRDEPWHELAAAQSGVVSRRQLLGLGWTPGRIGALLDARRWVRLHPGVYATFTGPVPRLASLRAALLAAGDGATAGATTALWLWQVLDAPPSRWTVCVPAERCIRAPRGTRVVRRRGLDQLRHPAASPPRLRLETALLDVADEERDPGAVVDLVLRAVGSRRTAPDRLQAALAGRRTHRHRRLLRDLLAESAEGVQSALEHRWYRDVERAHGLPRGERNRAEDVVGTTGRPRRRYRDVRYRDFGTVVELDGLEAHPWWQEFRVRSRDNAVTVAGDRPLKYGWRETIADPCAIAAEVALVLRRGGWTGTPTACGPGCRTPALWRAGSDGVVPPDPAHGRRRNGAGG